MFTATTYIVVSIALSVLMYFGTKEHHRVRDGVDIYRYQSVYVWGTFIGILAWVLGGGFIYSTYPPGEPSGISLFIFIMIIAGMTVAYFFFYFFLKNSTSRSTSNAYASAEFGRNVPFLSVISEKWN